MNRIVVRSSEGSVVSEMTGVSFPVTIGRHPENDIVLDDRGVSRRHLKVEAGPLGVRVVNLSRVASMRVSGRKTSVLLIYQRVEVEIARYRIEIDLACPTSHSISLDCAMGELFATGQEECRALVAQPAPPRPPVAAWTPLAARTPDGVYLPDQLPLALLPAPRVRGQGSGLRSPMIRQIGSGGVRSRVGAARGTLLAAFHPVEYAPERDPGGLEDSVEKGWEEEAGVYEEADEVPALWQAFALLTVTGILCQLLSLVFWEQSLVTLTARAVLIGPLGFVLALLIASPFALLSKIHGGNFQFRKLATITSLMLAVEIALTTFLGGRLRDHLLVGTLFAVVQSFCLGLYWFAMLRLTFSIREPRALGFGVGLLALLFLGTGIGWRAMSARRPSGFALSSSSIQVSRFARADPETTNRDLQLAISRSLAKSGGPSSTSSTSSTNSTSPANPTSPTAPTAPKVP